MRPFSRLFEKSKCFVAYITAGHRGLEFTEQAALSLVAGGVDILEIGVPFSDPIADGPVIQRAMTDALTYSVNIHSVLTTITRIKAISQVPIVLFTYFNPLLKANIKDFLPKAKQAGVDGMLVVDLPIEESALYFEQCRENNIHPICLISPSTAAHRVREISKQSNAFIYYVCRHGITGVKSDLPHNYDKTIAKIKSLINCPVVSGFGIGNRMLARQALISADGFVVGSAFVEAITHGASPDDLQNLATEIDPR